MSIEVSMEIINGLLQFLNYRLRLGAFKEAKEKYLKMK
jgi:hypothetical protein